MLCFVLFCFTVQGLFIVLVGITVVCVIYVDFSFLHYMAMYTILIHIVHKIRFFITVMHKTCNTGFIINPRM